MDKNSGDIKQDTFFRNEQLVDFVVNKIEFMSRPKDCNVILGATPVVSFGDFTKSRVATIGINPSSIEFLDKSKNATCNGLYPEDKKKLADLETIGILSTDPLDDDTSQYYSGPFGAETIWKGCRDYFLSPNAYWKWFGDLEVVLEPLSVSYKDSTACHLDLSPWATDPVFSELTQVQQKNLLLGEADFLRWQITKSPIELLLLNGAQVKESIFSLDDFELGSVREFTYTSGGAGRTSEFFAGWGPSGVQIRGWTVNLQALQATNDEKQVVFEILKDFLS
jgi:hypothetical protein